MAKYLVTGCAGFLGSTLTDALLAEGHEVVGIDAFTAYYPRDRKQKAIQGALGSPSFLLHQLDLTEAHLADLAGDILGVFHIAAQPGVRTSWGDGFPAYLANNVLASQRVLEFAAEARVRVVLASSSSIYGDAQALPTHETSEPEPVSPYGVTKLAAEHLTHIYRKDFDVDAVILRYFTVYGPRQRPDMAFARLIECCVRNRQFTVFGDGHQSRDFTFAADAVHATMLAMTDAPCGAVYNVGGGLEATMRDVIGLVESIAGKGVAVEFGERAAGDVQRTLADCSRIRDELGWRPSVSLQEGLQAQFDAAIHNR